MTVRRDGPESRDGWRATMEVDGVRVTVEARHATRRRLARSGGEISANIVRGRHPMAQVEDRTLEWAVTALGRRVATLTLEASRSIRHAGGRAHPKDTVQQAAADAYRAVAGRRATAAGGGDG